MNEPPPVAAPSGDSFTGSEGRAGRSALLVGLGILASRLVGLLRQRVFAHYFGDGWIADAFTAALRLPNITQNLLGEGTLSASFIPLYAQALERGEEARARQFARDILGLLILVAATISLVGAVFARPLTHLIVPGFEGERFALAVHLVRIFFPMTGILALSAWSLGVLNSHRHFFLPYVAPVIWSVCQIVAMLAGARHVSAGTGELALWLGYGALVGALLQFAVQLPRVRGLLGVLRPNFGSRSPDVRRAVRAFGPVLLGRGVVQLSAFFDTLLASLLPIGANAVLGYVQTIYLLPVSLFGVGAAAAALPEMARQAGDPTRGHAALRSQLVESLTRVGFTTIPATLVFLSLPDQVVGALYQTGRFDVATTRVVAAALAAAGVGLLANAGVRVLASAFYALGDTATPARLAVVRVVLSIGISYALMRRYGVVGLTAGAALGAWIEALLLLVQAHRKLGGVNFSPMRWGKMLASALLAVAAGMIVKRDWPGSGVLLRALASLGAFGVVYLGVAAALGLPDVHGVWAALRRRFSARR